ERDRLEVGAAVARGNETQAADLGGDVIGALHIARHARFAALHRIVREDVQAGHEVGRRDGGGGFRRRVFQGQVVSRLRRRGSRGEQQRGYERGEAVHGQPPHLGFAVTVKIPPSLRPLTPGLYISSACAGGRTNTPGVVARATYVVVYVPGHSVVATNTTRSARSSR